MDTMYHHSSLLRALPGTRPMAYAPAAAALAVLLALGGCASQGPAHTAAAQLDATALGLASTAGPSATDAAQLPPAHWWTALGDTQLDALIAQALAGSPSLAASQARFDKAMALASASSTATDVHGTFSADATRQR